MKSAVEELEKIIEDLTNEIAQSFYQTILLLEQVVITNDIYYEGSHARFVSQKSELVAKALGMTETEIFETKVAGLLHDIGKIGFGESILAKFPAEMTGANYQKYITHPQIGFKMLSHHKGFDSIGKIIFEHHERLDGSGFPRHLTGDEINPQAMIISLVDTFHNAVYKKQRPGAASARYASPLHFLDHSKSRYVSTMNYLNSKAGVLFDKTVFETFKDIIEAERKGLGEKTIMRLPVTKLKPGMVIIEDVVTNYGLPLCYSGETLTEELINSLLNTAKWREIPPKILVMT